MLIFHDGRDGKGGPRAATVDSVKLVVNALRTKGYTFTTVDNLLGIPSYH
ncbi:peptidoglycan/xylan/chitin deacetylase (PgdA/CDA1 family) [Kribbella aluminosa]|uniref:Peptidoglycan/xylan/chitin deacetylase (PgdA/CDA1 family) n=1 Tax=Kribbella aluminosa TaxID=416017 RepID=A0ABS4ULU1_9ACTN|nr:hypothetical protein [Kribbella aluminosa]MBP2352541.1 peptidoglycan/xylan/chitin deacetylase (PgdA/CDA1 family) [Kribbella aluminosa]